MLDALLNRETPCPVGDDPDVQRTRRARDEGERTVKQLKAQYDRLRSLTNPGNRSLEELQATPEQQDEAYALFPQVAASYHNALAQLKEAQQAYDRAHGKAYHLRRQWHQRRVQELEGKLIDMIRGPVRSVVEQIHDVIEEAAHEAVGIRLEPTPLPNVPLWIGGPLQSGLEGWHTS